LWPCRRRQYLLTFSLNHSTGLCNPVSVVDDYGNIDEDEVINEVDEIEIRTLPQRKRKRCTGHETPEARKRRLEYHAQYNRARKAAMTEEELEADRIAGSS
jgi:hypothetical protein